MSPRLPTVTAVMAVYNYADLVGRTLDSALGQDYPPELLDLVIVNDGSTDNTAEVLADYAARYPERITVITQENTGYVAATNRATAHATGEILAVLDADDLWPADKTRRQVEVLLARPEVGLVYSDTEIIDPYDVVQRPSLWQWHSMKPQRGDCFAEIMGGSGNVALASTIIFRAALRDELFPIPAGAPYVDWWVTARAAAIGEIEYLEDLKIGYRQHGENLTLGATGMRRVRETLKVAESRRQLLLHGAADHLDDSELWTAWKAWEGAGLTAVSQASSAYVPLPPVTDADRIAGAEHAAAAEAATRDGDLRRAWRERLLAVACNPFDASSREWLYELGWVGEQEAEEHTPETNLLDDARAFVTVAYAEELIAEPELLGAYAEVVSDDDDATLAVLATDLSEDRAVRAITAVAARVGLDLHRLPDVLLVTRGGASARIELERRADALLSRRPSRLGVPAYRPERMADLRARLTAGREPLLSA